MRNSLNGMLGMAAVCMGESDLGKIKDSLSVVYRRGEYYLRICSISVKISWATTITLDRGQFRTLEIVTSSLEVIRARLEGVLLRAYQDVEARRISRTESMLNKVHATSSWYPNSLRRSLKRVTRTLPFS